MKQKQIIALVSATALVATALAGCGKTSEENTQTTAVSTQTTAVSEAEGRSSIFKICRDSNCPSGRFIESKCEGS